MGAPLVEERKAGPEASPGVDVERVRPLSPAAEAGIKPGDRISGINNTPIRDLLDFYVESFEEALTLHVDRSGRTLLITIKRRPGEDIGIELYPEKPLLCGNNCVFCFVDQMPPGLRRSLYVKDEDYRLSFLHGNYLTLTNLDEAAEERIVRMHLSPLYVSVHATHPEARAGLLGRVPPEPLLPILDRLGKRGIRFHTQIVLVPGYNDGQVLERTLEDLSRREFILSVSVVPLGLTCHRDGLPRLVPVEGGLAGRTLHLISRIQERMRKGTGRGFAYAGDELFLIAGAPIPDTAYYDDFPQTDNGVGLIRLLLDSLRGLRVSRTLKRRHLAFVTGTSAAPFIAGIAEQLGRQDVKVEKVVVENRLFGPSVTVSGLLSGVDVIDALAGREQADLVVLPPNLLNPEGLTLDGLSAGEIGARAGIPVAIAEYDFKATLKRIDDVCRKQ
jgi:putative radical SAM enzyme (TIGR03279 family)